LNCCDFKLENSKEERRLIDNLDFQDNNYQYSHSVNKINGEGKVDKLVIFKSPGKQNDVVLEELSIFEQ